MKIGIVGLGAVGTAVIEGLQSYHKTYGYDIDGRGKWEEILRTDVVLICVPTNGLSDGKLSSEIVEDVIARLSDSDFLGLAIIKSTLQPGTMTHLHSSYRHIRMVYMPEFLREKDAIDWFQNPDRIVVGGSPEDVDEALSCFDWVPDSVPRLVMTFLEAEIGKLAHNAFIATKVTFTCEVEHLCRTFDANPITVMEVVWSDRRVLNSAHLTPGLGGFDGKCVPKDTQALKSLDVDTPLLDTVCETGNYDAVRINMDNISSKSINYVSENDISGRSDSIFSKIFKSLFTFYLIISLAAFPLFLGILMAYSVEDPSFYIINKDDSLVDIEVNDYITLLDINSTTLDSEFSSYTTCSSSFSGSGQDCDTTVTRHLTLVVYSTNISYELSSVDFVENCFGKKCVATGKVMDVKGDVRWLMVEDYYVL
tara:strand:+ start:5975 stop:7243 length:1269 start_codon:yes stop_codon:yes gene_type:complete